MDILTRDLIISSYFHSRYTYATILSFLKQFHGIKLSIRQLKRVLKRLGLKRRTGNEHIKQCLEVI